jgi:hypothetical protein
MSLEFYCRWCSTVAYKEIFKNYLKYWGSIVGGVLLSLELCCQQSAKKNMNDYNKNVIRKYRNGPTTTREKKKVQIYK